MGTYKWRRSIFRLIGLSGNSLRALPIAEGKHGASTGTCEHLLGVGGLGAAARRSKGSLGTLCCRSLLTFYCGAREAATCATWGATRRWAATVTLPAADGPHVLSLPRVSLWLSPGACRVTLVRQRAFSSGAIAGARCASGLIAFSAMRSWMGGRTYVYIVCWG